MSTRSVKERLTPHTPVERHFSQVQTQTSPYWKALLRYGRSILYMESWPYFACERITDSPYRRSALQIWTWADQIGLNDVPRS